MELKNLPSRNKGSWQKSLHTGVEWKWSHWTIRRFVSYLGGIFNKTITIIALALVGDEMILANSALCTSLAICVWLYVISYPKCACGIIMELMAGSWVSWLFGFGVSISSPPCSWAPNLHNYATKALIAILYL